MLVLFAKALPISTPPFHARAYVPELETELVENTPFAALVLRLLAAHHRRGTNGADRMYGRGGEWTR